MKRGTCRLCQRERPLCGSHIIPEFCYVPLYDEGHKALQMSPGGPESKVQKGFREPLLCEDCERFLNDQYEKPFLQSWFTDGKCPEHAPDKIIIVTGLDYVRFRLFHLSVLWRASVSSLTQFQAVQLGARHEEVIRTMLLGQDPGPPLRYPLCALLLELNGAVVREAIMTAATHRTPDGHRVYTIGFAGCLWAHFVGSHDAGGLVAHALRPPGEITLLRKNMAQLRHLKAFLNPDERTLRQFKVRTDTYTELDVAARLARHTHVRFLDPPALDITCSHENGRSIAIECKRVRSWKQIGKRLRDAVDQAQKQDLPAIVVLDVQPLLYQTNDPERPVYFDLVEDVSQLRADHEANLAAILSFASNDLQYALDHGIQAVCVCAMTWGWVLSTPEYRYSWVRCWIAADPETRAVLPLLDELLT